MTALRGDFGRQDTEPTATDRKWAADWLHAEYGQHTQAESMRARSLATALAAAREEGRQEVRAAVEALADELGYELEAIRREFLTGFGAHFNWNIADRLRAAVAPAQPADLVWRGNPPFWHSRSCTAQDPEICRPKGCAVTPTQPVEGEPSSRPPLPPPNPLLMATLDDSPAVPLNGPAQPAQPVTRTAPTEEQHDAR